MGRQCPFGGGNECGFIGDDTGDNISQENPFYNELTVIYWAWKNIAADAYGFIHYRRYFSLKSKLYRTIFGRWASILTGDEARQLMLENDIIVREALKWDTTIYEHGICNRKKEADENGILDHDYRIMREVLAENSPDYLPAYDGIWQRTSGHYSNMFIMKRDKLNEYLSWLFPLLYEYRRRLKLLDLKNPPSYLRRCFISECMLDVWLITRHYPYRDVPVIDNLKNNKGRWP